MCLDSVCSSESLPRLTCSVRVCVSFSLFLLSVSVWLLLSLLRFWVFSLIPSASLGVSPELAQLASASDLHIELEYLKPVGLLT